MKISQFAIWRPQLTTAQAVDSPPMCVIRHATIKRRLRTLTITALALGGVLLMHATPAHAQFLVEGTIGALTDQTAGASASATGIAGGDNANAGGLGSIAFGRSADATGNFANAIGDSANAAGVQANAIGGIANAGGNFANAIGASANAAGSRANAFGVGANAGGGFANAIGFAANAGGAQANAIGDSANAGFLNSTAIGTSATTTRDNQMVFGTTVNTYTTPGITSGASTAAQTGPRQLVTTDASGNLAADTPAGLGLASSADISGLQQDVRHNSEGVAMAMALGGIPNVLPRGKDYAVSSAWGGFNGENAVSLGGAAAITDNLFFSGGAALSTGRETSGGGRAGFTYAW